MRMFLLFSFCFVVSLAAIGCQKDVKPSSKTQVVEKTEPKETKEIGIKKDTCPERIRVMTYNVLAHGYKEDIRWPALIEIVLKHNPDIIVFQEAAHGFVKLLENQTELKKRYSFPKNFSSQAIKGLVTLSKHKNIRQEYQRLPSKLGRAVLYTDLYVCEALPQLRLANVHLESALEDGDIRGKQLKQIFAYLQKSKSSMLLGDYNFGDGEEPETSLIPKIYQDGWKMLHPEKKGYTWNKEKSQMAFQGSFPGEKSRRLDRIFIPLIHVYSKTSKDCWANVFG